MNKSTRGLVRATFLLFASGAFASTYAPEDSIARVPETGSTPAFLGLAPLSVEAVGRKLRAA
jgi:hypothetical protein